MSWWKKPLDLGVNAAAMTSDHDDDDQFNTEVARTLAEATLGILLELERLRLPASDWIIVERAVERVGASVCRRMLSRTKRFFERDFRANGGSTSAHIETPGRVWAGLLLHKVGVSREDLNYIFGVATLSQRRLISDAAGTAGSTKGCLVVPDVVEPPSKSHQQIAKALTLGLSMLTITANDLEVTGRVVERLGTDVARDMLALTQQVEEEGGEMSRDGTRRKTPLNVFLSLLKFKRDRFGVTDEDLRYIFENPKRLRRDTIREDMHYAPSLFTPIRPFSQLEKSGRDRDTIDFIKSFLVPALPCLEYIPIQDPRLDTVIAGTVFLGPAKMSMVERAVYTFGSDWVHETLQKINDDMMAAEDSKFSCTTAFKNSIKEYGTMAQYDFVVAQACEAHVSRDEVEEPVQQKRVTLAPRPNAVARGSYGKGKGRGKGKSGKGKGRGKGDVGKGWRRGHSSWRQHDPYEEDRYVPVLGRKRESPERVDEDGFVTVKQRRGGKRTSENEAVELRPALAVTKYTDHLATDHHDPAQPSPTTRDSLITVFKLTTSNTKTNAWFVAVKSGSVERVKELLESGVATLEIIDNEGWTAAHHCAMLDYSEMLEFLVTKKADVNATNKSKRTPLHISADWDARDCMHILTSNGADISLKDSAGRTPIQYASDDARGVLKEIARATAEAHSAFKRTTMRKQTQDLTNCALGDRLRPQEDDRTHLKPPVLHRPLSARGSADPALFLSTSSTSSAPPERERPSRAARVDRRQHLEQVFQASRMGDVETLKALMKKQQIDLNVQDKEGWTVMHHASFMGQTHIVRYLIDNGFEIGPKNKFGRTPLHLAAEWDNDEVVELLLSRKADFNVPDKDGCSPLEYTATGWGLVSKFDGEPVLVQAKFTAIRRKCAFRRSSVGSCEKCLDDLVEEEQLGTGLTADVYSGTWHGTDVAIKRVDWTMASDYEATKASLLRELTLMTRLRHPGIVMVMGACLSSRPLRLVCELCRGGSLDSLLYKQPEVGLCSKQKWKMCMDVAQAMNYLHTSTPMIVHRDLKSPNLLLAHPVLLKVSDFGLSRATAEGGDFAVNAEGTYTWMAPELLERPDFYTEKVDVYSYGICMYEVMARKMPFSEKGYEPLSIALHVAKGLRPDIALIPSGTPREMIVAMEEVNGAHFT
ncbi:serine-threonine protein kinase, putative [Perkinsus marinus ATCC 50983]|uniref:Serine-threonine protein kinase, putative n=1 Tax=Perkinsus marinus (strain ATCC 50983 / TXsc) TaxID=423536 RepID=C5L0Y8_PERM5|nr:serine-threonine protein kinase, putative [Perkinsus marinus ATCC 50983]EER09630.1 serine-threonine protein kinase, putative [Perkinsus marinus ATCC 50983]|eukprot:XP_002777835.1 serine-threonine protein kinase, putative [Perkinsus marinus ATCC 50983]